MAVVIRLKRAGAKKRPFYRIVTADSRRQRDGRFIEILGHYDPLAKPHRVVIDQERVAHWIANGARPSVQVASLLRSSGMKPATVGPAVSAAPTPSAGSTKK
jgi:small subunit ribosomal protein S16